MRLPEIGNLRINLHEERTSCSPRASNEFLLALERLQTLIL
jgi:hypothetical protein